MTTVRHTDGIEVELPDGRVVHADASRPDGDIAVCSHAHGDHLYSEAPDSMVCSELTAALAGVRRDDAATPSTHPDIELLDAGHVPGSRATLITSKDTEHDETVRILYTGDVSTRDRFYLDGFQPVDADILVVEATYGTPEYVFPPQAELEAEIVDWFEDTADQPVICMGYTLGRAQEIQRLAQRAGRSRLLVTDAIAEINSVVEAHLDVDFGAQPYNAATDLSAGDVLVLPGQTNSLSFVDQLRESSNAIKAGFSGWAIDSSFKFRGDYDETFVLSDHCDHEELLNLVRGVDPEQVYVQHGAVDEFASYLTRETPYRAQSLQQNQSTLDDF
ncbi:MBL fold metallo-hydrolase RNA specificity domain-containing protein [Halorientalis regularis]|uniref:Putative mRNA 3-end processing factor n=1 Tax=Halorientalis regularis TaxID=660518 RepID=A0A1G7T732_9EURY|nr:MBL fold metallo-hydrolase RNA specificity domain-containing protein [Halorientalis regularis]SDG31187.1 putative mRNA 3-end processing factor [Halorientalis regularis]